MYNFKELRKKLTPEDIKNILAKLEVYSEFEKDGYIVFPTACHNLENGSPKLYYYVKDTIFKCYTECKSAFDIFDLIIKIHKLRGVKLTIKEAVYFAGLGEEKTNQSETIMSDLMYLKRASSIISAKKSTDTLQMKTYNKDILNLFEFNELGLKPWMIEGISEEALKRFNISYDKISNAIIIPNFNENGDLIGVRGRFFDQDAKYMPIKIGNEYLSYSTGKYLYGFFQNKNSIMRKNIVVVFEGEKSVLKMETIYPNENFSVATLGKKITLDQLNLLLKLKPSEVILAYDKDYRNEKERKQKIEEYEKIINILKPYFACSILVDYNNKLDYKDSPIEKGKEVFEELIKIRLKR